MADRNESGLGPMGARLADNLAAKIADTIDGFPTPTHGEKAAIAARLAERMDALAAELRRGDEQH